MSNIRAITGSTRIMNRPSGGGSKLQGIPSSTNLNTTSQVAFRNRNVVCPCHRHHVFCMNQLGGVGAGGVPGNSYMFASTADGINKNKILCGMNHKNIKYPSQFELIYSQPVGGTSNPLLINFITYYNKYLVINGWKFSNYIGNEKYSFITNCFNLGSGGRKDTNCNNNNKEVVGNIYGIIFTYNGKFYNVLFIITEYYNTYLYVNFLSNPSSELLNILLSGNSLNIINLYQSTYKV